MAKACSAKTITGAACRAAAGEGGLCFFHAHPESAKKLGRLGGQKNRRSVAVDLHVPDNINANDLSKLNAQAMRLLLSGELHAREASAFAQLANSQLRVIQAADLEARVARLETDRAAVEGSASTDGRDVAHNDEPAVDGVDRAAGARGADFRSSGSAG
jgi:hypothetical protein